MCSPEGMVISRQHGGSYFELDNLIRKAYFNLINMGFTVTMYFDGHSTLFKEATLEKRLSTREQQWEEIYHITLLDNINIIQDKLSLPPLTFELFKYTLNSLGAEVIYSEYEADQDISIACK